MRRWKDHALLATGAAVMGLPLVLLVVAATRPGGLSGRAPLSLVPGSGLSANIQGLADIAGAGAGGVSLAGMVAASLVAGTGVAVLTTVLSFLAAYALIFLHPARPRLWFALTLATLYFPIEARMLPTFDVAAGLGLINTAAGLVLPILPLALGTFVFRQHMLTIPPEYLEAARLDGAGPIAYLRDFVVPMSSVPIGAVLVITFILGWNQYLWPLMISVDNSQFTLMRGLNLLGAGTGPSMVLAVVSILPPLVLVVGFQRLMASFARLQL